MKMVGMRSCLVLLACWALSGAVGAQNLLTATFTHTNEPGWTIGGVAFLTVPLLDADGSGWLRLTDNAGSEAGYALYNTAIPATNGIQVGFDFNDWGGGDTPADGLVIAIIDGSQSPTMPGGTGGSIGYAQNTSAPTYTNGIVGGMLGIALDEFGNFSNPTEGRQGGPGQQGYTVTIRGPGNGTSSALITTPGGTENFPNYNYVTNSAALTSTILVPQPFAGSRPTGVDVRHAVVNFDMSDIANTNAYVGVKIYDGNGNLLATPVGNANVGLALVQYFGAGNVPTSFKLSLTSGTGMDVNTHEVQNLVVTNAAPGGSFGATTATVTTDVNPTGGGSVTGGGDIPIGSNTVLTAMPSNGWLFVNWSDGTTNSSDNITVVSNITYTANFAPAATVIANVNPVPGGSATGSGTYFVGTSVQLTTANSNGWMFTGWNDGIMTTTRTITVPATNITYTANFARCIYVQDRSEVVTIYALNNQGQWAPVGSLGDQWSWRLKATGDINGDGQSEIFWETPDNWVTMWQSVSGAYQGVSMGNLGSWELRAVADVDGDGIPDLIYQNATGDTVVWYMNHDGSTRTTALLAQPGTWWTLKAAADINGDGKADLFWESPDGWVVAWLSTPSGYNGVAIGNLGSWDLRAAIDIDGDGIPDLLWEDSSGWTALWYMKSDCTFRATQPTGNIGPYDASGPYNLIKAAE